MKRNSIIVVIVVLALTTILLSLQKGTEKNQTISGLQRTIFKPTLFINSKQPTTKQIETTTTQTTTPIAQAKGKTTNIFQAKNQKTVTIGIMDSTTVDNPMDNQFHIQINREINPNEQAYLEYELYGVQDFNSVCKGIN